MKTSLTLIWVSQLSFWLFLHLHTHSSPWWLKVDRSLQAQAHLSKWFPAVTTKLEV